LPRLWIIVQRWKVEFSHLREWVVYFCESRGSEEGGVRWRRSTMDSVALNFAGSARGWGAWRRMLQLTFVVFFFSLQKAIMCML